jgi:hypothetical protein
LKRDLQWRVYCLLSGPTQPNCRYSLDSSHFFLDRSRTPSHNRVSLSTIGANTESGAVAFTATHWSVVLEAQGESPAAQKALEKLYRTY